MTKQVVFVSIKERFRLNTPLSQKQTYHIVLDLKGHHMPYSVGDCIGIYPTNDPIVVNSLLKILEASGDETVRDKTGQTLSLYSFLSEKANLGNKKFLDLLDQKIKMSSQQIVDQLSPLLPRFYSIASSHNHSPGEIHLTVAVTEFESEGQKKLGACSDFLCHRTPLQTPIIPVFHHPAREFTLSEESFSKPIIMIGPGTGIAPFRGFMQERALKAPHQKNWLFFGERHRKNDFYYESYWSELVRKGHLRLDTAFSRDQEHKIYVQHKMQEYAKEFWQWLEAGAYLFVCGDATRMAKDVEATLLQIAHTQGDMSLEKAKEFVRDLRKKKRYLRDVY